MLSVNEKNEVNNYPYGRLKCTAFFSIEFSKTKGFRHIFQTINPKTGRFNAEKKSTYSDLCYMVNDNGFITQRGMSMNGKKELNKAAIFLSENFDLFTPEQIEYFYIKCLAYLKMDMISTIQYGGATLENLKPLYKAATEAAVKGCKEKTNQFHLIVLDKEAIKATCIEGYNPFKTTTLEMA